MIQYFSNVGSNKNKCIKHISGTRSCSKKTRFRFCMQCLRNNPAIFSLFLFHGSGSARYSNPTPLQTLKPPNQLNSKNQLEISNTYYNCFFFLNFQHFSKEQQMLRYVYMTNKRPDRLVGIQTQGCRLVGKDRCTGPWPPLSFNFLLKRASMKADYGDKQRSRLKSFQEIKTNSTKTNFQ